MEFDGPLDLVIDDASHFYGPTLASFETLFPLLTPGGLYIIEDWAWGHWPGFIVPDHPWAGTPLTQLVVKIIEAAGTSTGLFANVTVYEGFISVERGPLTIDDVVSSVWKAILSGVRPEGSGPQYRQGQCHSSGEEVASRNA